MEQMWNESVVVNAQLIHFRNYCDDTYYNGRCTIIPEYPSVCSSSNVPEDQVNVEITYTCLLPDGSTSTLFYQKSGQINAAVQIDCHC